MPPVHQGGVRASGAAATSGSRDRYQQARRKTRMGDIARFVRYVPCWWNVTVPPGNARENRRQDPFCGSRSRPSSAGGEPEEEACGSKWDGTIWRHGRSRSRLVGDEAPLGSARSRDRSGQPPGSSTPVRPALTRIAVAASRPGRNEMTTNRSGGTRGVPPHPRAERQEGSRHGQAAFSARVDPTRIRAACSTPAAMRLCRTPTLNPSR
jgi:hypothetical protein